MSNSINVTIDGGVTGPDLSEEEVEDIVGALIQGGSNVTATYDDANDALTISAADTNTQLSEEDVDDFVADLLSAGSNVSISYDDGNDALTIGATDTDTQRTDEEIEDVTGSLISGGSNVTVTYDDANGTLTISSTDTDTDTHTDVSEDGSTVVANVDDINLTESGASTVTVTDDGDGSATVDISSTDTDTQLSEEEVDDFVANLLSGGSNVSISYDDANDTLTIDATDTDTNTHTDVSDDGSTVVSDTSDINFGSNVSVADDGDGSVTVSASGSGTDSFRNVPVGIVYIDAGGDYAAESFVTDESWTSSSDTGTVLQSLVDAVRDARNTNANIGEVQFGVGTFTFETPVVFNDHRGTTLTGQSFRQSNDQAGTQIVPGSSFPAGRGILEFGNIGDGSTPGDGEATHIRGIYSNLNGQDIVGIYNWSQDRVRTTDVKIVDPGPNGCGIAYFGSFNTNFIDSYFDQAALVRNLTTDKDLNSLRLHNTTFNTANSGHPPIIIHSQGTRITNSIFNGVDGPAMADGLSVVSEDASLSGILSADSRVGSGDVQGQTNRMQFASCTFVTGGNDVSAFDTLRESQITASRFSSSGTAINNFTRSSILGCRFVECSKGAISRPDGESGGGESTIAANVFQDYGSNNGEPAIYLGSNQNSRVSITGNSFRTTHAVTNDFEAANNAARWMFTSNWCENGVSATIGTAMIDSSRSEVPKLTGNSVNPIGFSRATPSLPSGTGSSNSVANLECQGAWIHHDGGSGININEFGTTTTLGIDTSPVFVPRAGEIWFDSAVPTAWEWSWV